MEWSKVGDWLKGNAGAGASLVGSLLTGNLPGAVAAGVALVSSATGTTDAAQALQALQQDPATLVRLRERALQDEASIRAHIQAMRKMEMDDAQAAHHETQETIRNGDNSEDTFTKRTRPGQSWVSLFAALAYVFTRPEPSIEIIALLLALPWAYAGLRQIGKGIDSLKAAK